jgi:hypothetical protein
LPAELSLARALLLEHALENHEQRRHLHRLGEQVLRSVLDRAHREVDGGVAGEDHDGQCVVGGLEAGQEVEGVAVGEQVVHDRGVEARAPACRLRGLAPLRLHHFESLGLEEVAHPEADRGLVVDDEDAVRHVAS